MEDGIGQRVTAAQREELDAFMFENPSLVRGATELSPALSRDDKVRLWTELTSFINTVVFQPTTRAPARDAGIPAPQFTTPSGNALRAKASLPLLPLPQPPGRRPCPAKSSWTSGSWFSAPAGLEKPTEPWTKGSDRDSSLNYLGPPRKEPEGWKRYWAVRVSKARARAAELAKQARQTGGGGGQVRSLASSYARILTLVGEDSALGAPGFSVPAFEDEAEGRPAGAQAGHGQQAAEPVPSTSRDVRPPVRPRVRPTAPRATPRMSRQERHDEAAMQAVANSTLQLQQNEARDARDVGFQGQVLAQTQNSVT
ncbi:hypothetical protein HPB47_013240 [Ixodes persulcatus]|uniref:Uncharacterized protein n=1 Tax=Ixodes persulcatus TaxID=34615 RepID=A0AC60R0C9_IXOPE|nr:hypothetical protein HPB47_013240 [Ixodes persulcatus]